MRFVLLIALALSAACGVAGTPPPRMVAAPLHPFATPAEMQQAAKRAASHPRADLARVRLVPEWSLALAPPNAAADELLRRAINQAKAATTPTEPMHCVAHEVARLMATLGNNEADRELLRFIAGRCGALGLWPGYYSWTSSDVPKLTDAQVLAEKSRSIQEALVATLGKENAPNAGLGFVRDGNAIFFVLALERPLVSVEPFERVAFENGWLRVRGRVLFEADLLEGYVTAGRLGVRACTFDRTLIAPEFEMTCELTGKDRSAWVQLLARPRNGRLPKEVLQVLALREAEAEREYKLQPIAKSLPVQTEREFRENVVTLVNEVRAAAQLARVALSEEQSLAASEVVAPLVSDYERPSQEIGAALDQVTSGLMAGWHVRDRAIEGARVTMGMTMLDAPDAGEWLARAFVHPYNRMVFLAPETKVLAIGATVRQAPAAIGAVVLAYRTFEGEASRQDAEEALRARLIMVRKDRGLGETTLIQSTEHLDTTLRRIRDENLDPKDSLWSLVNSTAGFTGLPTHGFVWVTHDLEAIEFPLQVLERGHLRLSVGVTHFRPEGSAWGQYAVFFLIVKANKSWSKANAS